MYDIDFMEFVNFRLIPVLERLSNAEYQIEVWGKKHPKYQDSYSETIDEIFEVYPFFEESAELGERTLSKENLLLFKELHDKVWTFGISREPKDTESLIKNSKWIEIQKMAGRLLESVKQELSL